MHHKGHPNRLLRGLELGQPIDRAGVVLLDGDREVGRLTSPVMSPRLGPIGLSIVRREVEPGSELSIDGANRKATVIALPFER
jgi:glycine cleavage system aminomethyltransferase T